MKRFAYYLMVVVFAVVLHAGCGGSSDDGTPSDGDDGGGDTGTVVGYYDPCKLITLQDAEDATGTTLQVDQHDIEPNAPQPMICHYSEPIGTKAKYTSVQLSIHSQDTLPPNTTAEDFFDLMLSYVTNVEDVSLGDDAFYTADIESQGVNVLVKAKSVYFKVNVNEAVSDTVLENSRDIAEELAQIVINRL